MGLWEILIPTITNYGEPIRTRFHRIWDEKIRKLAGGLTIPSVGDIYCDREIIEEIIQISLKYYHQEAIMAYKVSDEVIVRFKHD